MVYAKDWHYQLSLALCQFSMFLMDILYAMFTHKLFQSILLLLIYMVLIGMRMLLLISTSIDTFLIQLIDDYAIMCQTVSFAELTFAPPLIFHN